MARARKKGVVRCGVRSNEVKDQKTEWEGLEGSLSDTGFCNIGHLQAQEVLQQLESVERVLLVCAILISSCW